MACTHTCTDCSVAPCCSLHDDRVQHHSQTYTHIVRAQPDRHVVVIISLTSPLSHCFHLVTHPMHTANTPWPGPCELQCVAHWPPTHTTHHAWHAHTPSATATAPPQPNQPSQPNPPTHARHTCAALLHVRHGCLLYPPPLPPLRPPAGPPGSITSSSNTTHGQNSLPLPLLLLPPPLQPNSQVQTKAQPTHPPMQDTHAQATSDGLQPPTNLIMYHQNGVQSLGQQTCSPMFQSLSGRQLAGLAAVTAVHYDGFWIVPSYSGKGSLSGRWAKYTFCRACIFNLWSDHLVQGLGTTFSTMQRLRSGAFG